MNTTTTKPNWMDPVYWKGVRIGQCQSCKRQGKDVTRKGLCWICEVAESKPLIPHNGFGNTTNLFD